MLVLTFTTGVVDAVGFLGLDQVFAGNMTGNVVILGMALAGSAEVRVLGPGVALAAFVAGAFGAGRVLRGSTGSTWALRHTVLFTLVGGLLGAVSVLLLVTADGDAVTGAVAAGGLAAAMGLQAGTARHLAVKDVTTVVVTSTLTGLAADAARGHGQPWVRRLLAVLLLVAGAGVGALSLRLDGGWGIMLAAVATLGVAAAGHAVARRAGPGQVVTRGRARAG
ncbi:hypothetical protein AFB00_24065 [Pseudonocardia sp. HH130630-07]|nr:hypothetical protein AFB00_24065 [Pseudonocardia sp. HH130630-07]